MNIVYFDKTDTDIPSDLISKAEVAKITGYSKDSLFAKTSTKVKIKDYCTIYKLKNKATYCIFYSKREVLEFLNYEGLERADLFNKSNFYTYQEISSLYGIKLWELEYLMYIIRKINIGCLLNNIKVVKVYTVKRKHYIEKNSADELMEALGYKKKE